MCQYSATDGRANQWHHANYAGMARGGAGLVIVEATAVSPAGRLPPGCTGIWNDDLAQAFIPPAPPLTPQRSAPAIPLAPAGPHAPAPPPRAPPAPLSPHPPPPPPPP